jgi:2-keto-4-pentenoate hydratase
MSEIDLNAAQHIAYALWQAQQNGTPVAPVRAAIAELGGDALEAAYAVQRLNTERKLATGRRLVGRKIGLTSKAVQAQLGVDQPDFGMLFDDMSIADGEEIPMSRAQRLMRCPPSKSSAAGLPTGISG